jgi:hypothetical protein
MTRFINIIGRTTRKRALSYYIGFLESTIHHEKLIRGLNQVDYKTHTDEKVAQTQRQIRAS